MKSRLGFVSNSSSSSFILSFNTKDPTIEEIGVLIRQHGNALYIFKQAMTKIDADFDAISDAFRSGSNDIPEKEEKLQDELDRIVTDMATRIKSSLRSVATKDELLEEIYDGNPFRDYVESEFIDQLLAVKEKRDKAADIIRSQSNKSEGHRLREEASRDELQIILQVNKRMEELTEAKYKWYIYKGRLIPENAYIVEFGDDNYDLEMALQPRDDWRNPRIIALCRR